MSNKIFDLKERVVLYFDILGYKAAFEEENFDSMSYLDTIKCAMNHVKNMNISSFESSENTLCMKLKIFSDNACIVFDLDRNTAFAMAKIIAMDIQQHMLEQYGVLIRGSITDGEIYMDDVIVFGKGLINSVMLEHEAKYPRIIIDHVFDDLFDNDAYGILTKSVDEYYEVNYLYGFDNSCNIQKIRQQIVELTNRHCSMISITEDMNQKERIKLIKKYLWLVEVFNACNPLESIKYDSDTTYYIDI